MRFRTKIYIDRWIGPPLLLLLVVLMKIASRLRSKDSRTVDSRVENIVITKFYGLGSIIQATPLIRGLRNTFPNAKITLLTAEKNKPLVERILNVDDALYINESSLLSVLSSTVHAVLGLNREQIDFIFDLEIYSNYSVCLSVLSGARKKFGFFRNPSKLKKFAYTRLSPFDSRQNIRDIYLQLGVFAGMPSDSAVTLEAIKVYPHDRMGLKDIVFQRGYRTYVVINPNASELCFERRWPKENFSKVVLALTQLGIMCVLIGSTEEVPYVDELVALLPNQALKRVVNSTGKLEFGELLALIEGAKCILTNDTGPMHISFSFKKPTFCLFGPVDPVHYGVEESFARIFYTRLPCSPCLRESNFPPCHGNNICLKSIEPNEVLEAIISFLVIEGDLIPIDKAEVNFFGLEILYKNYAKTLETKIH